MSHHIRLQKMIQSSSSHPHTLLSLSRKPASNPFKFLISSSFSVTSLKSRPIMSLRNFSHQKALFPLHFWIKMISKENLLKFMVLKRPLKSYQLMRSTVDCSKSGPKPQRRRLSQGPFKFWTKFWKKFLKYAVKVSKTSRKATKKGKKSLLHKNQDFWTKNN